MKTSYHHIGRKGLGILFMPLCLLAAMLLASCQDVMDTDSDRQIFDPKLDQKTDSMFYTLGILKGVQQAMDQYVLVGEMRGDLATTNTYSETALRDLADFSATTANKYDSAYVWYRIINNCNYYIAHRDTTLMTGSRHVARNEYVQALTIRAWAYMQLAKTYGRVPFYTTPVTSISEANAAAAGDQRDLQGIVDALAPELEKYSGTGVPDYGNIDAGKTNAGTQKNVTTSKIMFPVDLVLGDMYLETNQYEKAAQSYWTYIRDNRVRALPYIANAATVSTFPNGMRYPSDMSRTSRIPLSWDNIFTTTVNSDEVITYVPMAVNSLLGTTTNLPKLFGWDFYTTNVDTTSINLGLSNYNQSTQYVLERQVDPSPAYFTLANKQFYYYRPTGATANTVSSAALGDIRRQKTCRSVTVQDSTFFLMTKYEGANINIYRAGVVYLRLAEALNRMGYPDAAFAVLKDGLGLNQLQEATYTTDSLGNYVEGYLRDTTRTLLTDRYQFLSETYGNYFTTSALSTTYLANYGIHLRGSGEEVAGRYSGYQYVPEVLNKMAETGFNSAEDISGFLDNKFGDAAIDAIEDLICDEYALETAFEGNRFGDLERIARHKNASSYGGANYGGRWLASKLAFKHPVKDLSQESNWYMPFR